MTSDHSHRVNEAIADFLQASQSERDPRVWLAAHPELDEELREFLEDYMQLQVAVDNGDHPSANQIFEQSAFKESLISEFGASENLIDETVDAVKTGSTRPKPRIQVNAETLPREFGDYDLLEQVAFGGMGVVYKARHRQLDRIVAIKMILAGQFATHEDVDRFFREARAAGSLEHPSIVPVYEVGTVDGQHYFSMGFVDGGSLSDLLSDGPLEAKRAAVLTQKIARAVDYAHQEKIVHRDLKPSNVLITRDGKPKVTDFGLASRQDDAEAFTATGQILGTPAWMPPEQATGRIENIGPRSDIYSIGAVLYALLTGRPPFLASQPLETLRQVTTNEPVAPRDLNPNVPIDLETICLKCLEKNPSRRYDSANAIADELGRFLKGEPINARPVSGSEKLLKWVGRNQLVSGLIASVGIALMLGTIVSTYFAIEADARAKAEQKAREDYQSKEAEATKLATEKAALAKDQAKSIDELQNNLYVSRLKEAQAALDAGDYETTRRLLEKDLHGRGKVDHRCFVWHYLYAKLERADPIVFRRPNASENVRLIPNLSRSHVVALSRGDLQVIRVSDMKVVMRQSGGESLEQTDVCFINDDQIAVAKGRGTSTDPITGRYKHHGVLIYELNQPVERTFRLSTPPEIKRTNGPDTVGICVAASPDSKLLATGLCDGGIGLWDAQNRQFVSQLKSGDHAPGKTRDVIRLKFTPDGTKLISIRYNLAVEIWDVEKRKRIERISCASDGRYQAIGFRRSFWLADRADIGVSSDGKIIATSGNPKNIQIISNDKISRVLVGQRDATSTLDFVPNTHILISGGQDGNIRYWNADTGQQLPRIGNHPTLVGGVVVLPSSQEVLSFGGDNRIRKWRLPDPVANHVLNNETRVSSIKFQPGSDRMVTGGWPEGFYGTRVFDLNTLQRETLEQSENKGSRSNVVDVTPDGSIIAIGTHESQAIEILDRNLSRLQRIVARTAVWDLSLHPLGHLVVTSDIGQAQVWDTLSGQPLANVPGQCYFSYDGQHIVSCTGESVYFHRVTGKRIGESEPTDIPAIYKLRFSRNGRFMAGILREQQTDFVVVDLETRSVVFRASGHYAKVNDLAFAPDGTTLASVGVDHRTLLWDLVTGRIKAELGGHASVVHAVDFSPDGTTLATGSWDSTVRLWRAPTVEVAPPQLTLKELVDQDRSEQFAEVVAKIGSRSFDHSYSLEFSDTETVKSRVTLPLDAESIEFSAEGLHAIPKSGTYRPIQLCGVFQGDFEVTATLSEVDLSDSGGVNRAIGLAINFDNALDERFSLDLKRESASAEGKVLCVHSHTPPDTNETKGIFQRYPVSNLRAERQLRLVRISDVIHFLHRPPESDEFQLLTSRQVLDVPSDVVATDLFSFAFNNSEPPTVLWKNLSFRWNGDARGMTKQYLGEKRAVSNMISILDSRTWSDSSTIDLSKREQLAEHGAMNIDAESFRITDTGFEMATQGPREYTSLMIPVSFTSDFDVIATINSIDIPTMDDNTFVRCEVVFKSDTRDRLAAICKRHPYKNLSFASLYHSESTHGESTQGLGFTNGDTVKQIKPGSQLRVARVDKDVYVFAREDPARPWSHISTNQFIGSSTPEAEVRLAISSMIPEPVSVEWDKLEICSAVSPQEIVSEIESRLRNGVVEELDFTNPSVLNEHVDLGSTHLEPTKEGLKCFLQENSDQLGRTCRFERSLSGDFDIQIHVGGFNLDGDCHNDAFFALSMADGKNIYYMKLYQDPGQPLFCTGHHTVVSPKGERQDKMIKRPTNFKKSGHLRLVRLGDQIHLLQSANSDDDYQLVATFPIDADAEANHFGFGVWSAKSLPTAYSTCRTITFRTRK